MTKPIASRRSAALFLVVAILTGSSLAGGQAPEDRRLAAKAFRAAVARVEPSMVVIETYGGVSIPATTGRRHGPRRGRRRRIRPVAKPGEGPTTGLIVSPDGHILTSTFNFLRQPPVITVVLADGSRHVATLLGRDNTRKLCLLKIDGVADLPVPVLTRREQLKVGQWAISAGFGYGGDEPALSAGIISAVSRMAGKAVQTDANISPANYGGPLVDIEGRVIGLCVPLSPRHQGPAGGVAWYDSGIGFAIPLDGLDPILEQMKAGKTIEPGKLGVVPARQPAKGGGVTVRQVQKGSGAEKAGIQAKDVIVALDGRKTLNVLTLRRLLARHVAGDRVTVTVRRGEKTLQLEVTLTAGDEARARPPGSP
ncbi:MAG: S1C family serine protease [Planctomycetota bacterium]